MKFEYSFKNFFDSYGRVIFYGGLLISISWFLVAPISCGLPKEYSLGEIDERFALTDREIINVLKEAEDIWEKELGIDIFKFNPRSDVKVNFLYDDRQRRTDDGQRVDQVLTQIENKRDDIKNEYNEIKNLYDELVTKHKEMVFEYENQVEEFNKTVDYWNKRQGAPERIYETIKNEQADLNDKREKIEELTLQINRLVTKLNSISGSDQKLVETYNSTVNSFERQYGSGVLFNRAEFTGQSINVYEFDDKNTLRLALAHEMGHYIGIGHVSEKEALMYYLMEDQDLDNPKLTNSDIESFEKICPSGGDRWFSRLIQIWEYLQNKI